MVGKKQETLHPLKVIVDANIVFSGILNTKSKIEFIAPDFLRTEIHKHYSKLASISKLSVHEVKASEFQVCKDIKFISEEQISTEIWVAAHDLVKDIDEKDVPYVAFSEQFSCKIWSGDKKLISGLEKKGFRNFISTNQLIEFREKLRSHRSKGKR